MRIKVFKNKKEASEAAAKKAAAIIKKAIKVKGKANIVAATGKSQISFLRFLTKDTSIDWSKVSLFHLDEYVGLKKTHKASLRNYILKRIVDKVHPGEVHLIDGNRNPVKECERLGKIISRRKIDVAFLGVGINGHIAFNDPPADMKTRKPFIVVKLSDISRKQQVDEKLFAGISSVPKRAISMSINQIMKSDNIILLAFGKRKAKIVKECFGGRKTTTCPASVLKKGKNISVYMDGSSASAL